MLGYTKIQADIIYIPTIKTKTLWINLLPTSSKGAIPIKISVFSAIMKIWKNNRETGRAAMKRKNQKRTKRRSNIAFLLFFWFWSLSYLINSSSLILRKQRFPYCLILCQGMFRIIRQSFRRNWRKLTLKNILSYWPRSCSRKAKGRAVTRCRLQNQQDYPEFHSGSGTKH